VTFELLLPSGAVLCEVADSELEKELAELFYSLGASEESASACAMCRDLNGEPLH